MRRIRRIIGAVAGIGLVLAPLTACSGGDSPAPAASEGTESEAVEPITLNIGFLPIPDVAPIYLGVEKGFFEEEGLTLNIDAALTGQTQGVVAGTYDFAMANTAATIVAASQGIPIRYVAPGGAEQESADTAMAAVIVAGDSPIEGAKDLEGKRVAVNQLGSIASVTIDELVRQAGGDPSTIQYSELGFPNMGAALDAGEVDAAWVVEPFRSINELAGKKVVMHNLYEVKPGLLFSTYFTTEAYAQQNPEIVERFVRAVIKSNEYADANPEEARAILSSYLTIDPAIQASLRQLRWPSEIDRDSIQLLIDLLEGAGTITNAPSVDDLIL
ncbi:MAG: ABC transporter substrate-binding protein [Candidatus Leucobacter sulfamidivorax]|nr:ABC transporter substrate-binding protein [Candidatus Leucobacter sulfamidivorax]